MIKVIVCLGTNCSFQGGMQIHDFLEQDPLFHGRIELVAGKCFQEACKPDQAPVVSVDGELIRKATLDKVLAAVRERLP